jgi:hypothetical protein
MDEIAAEEAAEAGDETAESEPAPDAGGEAPAEEQ